MNEPTSAKEGLNRDLQRLRETRQFVVVHRPLAALDLGNLRLIELDAETCESAHHILLRNLRRCRQPQAEDVLAGDVATFGFHGALEGAPILILFSAGIILYGTKIAVALVNPSADQPLTILCADDHTLVGDALTKVFSTAGYSVERASDGEEAWQKVVSNLRRFDVVITDHQMPRLDGLQLVGRLRDAKFAGRIIVYSSGLSMDDQSLYREMGVDAIVIKGPDAARLLEVVKALHRQE